MLGVRDIEDNPEVPVLDKVELLRGRRLAGTRESQARYSSDVNTDGVLKFRSEKKIVKKNNDDLQK